MEVFLLASSLVISLHNSLFPSTRSANANANTWYSSFVPSPHETEGSIHYLAHDDVHIATDGDDISIDSTEEMEKYDSLHQREFGHTCVYDVNLLERVGMDEGLPLILWIIGWGKLYGGDRTTRATDG
jgi:hypothetical protein